MRLAILTTHPVQYYAPLFRELSRRMDVHVFYAHQATREQQAAAGFGTPFEWDVDLTSGYEHSFLRNVASNPNASSFSGCDTPEIGARLTEGRFDAVLTLGWHVKSLLQGIWAARRQGLPVLVRGDSQLGLQPSRLKRAVKRVLYPALLRVFDGALVVGSRNRAFFAHYGYPEDRMFHSPHAVDTEFFRERAGPEAGTALRAELGIAADKKVVLFAGKLLDFKRPLDVVRAVSGLRRRGLQAEILVAGAGPLEHTLRVLAGELKVPVHLPGFVNQTRMPNVYAAADALALPSGRESWGLVTNEALACGLPVVVSDAAGCAPDLCDGKAGIAYPCGNIRELEAALARMLENPPTAEEIAYRSAQHGLERAAEGILQGTLAMQRARRAVTRGIL